MASKGGGTRKSQREDTQQPICRYDLPHFGSLCQRIRERRGIDKKRLANWCGVSPSTITRLEQKHWQGENSFEQLARVFQDRDKFKPPLEDRQLEIVRRLYANRGKVTIRRQEEYLKALDFQFIAQPEKRRPEGVNRLLADLAKLERPGFIMDDLWFIHAINGAQMRLFGVEPNSEFLNSWWGWHVVAAKFPKASPVRLAYQDINDQFIPATFVQFFEYERTHPLLFTLQMRKLICKLIELSEEHNYWFDRWWSQVTAFETPSTLRSTLRTLAYSPSGDRLTPPDDTRDRRSSVSAGRKTQGHVQETAEIVRVHTEPSFLRSCDVVAEGRLVRYTLGVWSPASSDADKVFQQILSEPESRRIYYAAEYDTSRTFHVNRW